MTIPMWLVLLALTWGGRTCLAQERESVASRFLSEHGLKEVAPAVRAALDVFLAAQEDYRQGRYDRASSRLGAFWKIYPAGSKDWASLDRTGYELGRTKGVFIGTPPCYYALRMLTEAAQWRVRSRPLNGITKPPAAVLVT